MLILNRFILSDNIEYLKSLPDNCIDAIITDSPYGLGKKQDLAKLLPAWVEHGFYEIKGTGFMGKKWDAFVPQPILWKECLRVLKPGGYLLSFFGTRTYHLGSLAIELAGFEIRDCIQWIYGSGFPKSKASLKPANEPICVARKPGPLQMLNIDEARVTGSSIRSKSFGEQPSTKNAYSKFAKRTETWEGNTAGRWPSNVIFDDETAYIVDDQSGVSGGDKREFKIARGGVSGYNYKHGTPHKDGTTPAYNDIGGASRFFYVAKASPSERKGMKHPTIKPVKLMEQLVKLYCPEGGIVLDPHFGSGPTGEACENTGRNWIGIDNDPDSIADATIRMSRIPIDLFSKAI